MSLSSQHSLDFIALQNPSFEDHAGAGRLPHSWYFCGSTEETPPDIHPGGWFRVNKAPKEGQTYVGMVVRDNGTGESIGQRLNKVMEPGQCYHLRLYAARSEEYYSVSRSSYKLAHFDQSVKLQLWGATKNCTERVLLGESPLIESPEWQAYDIQFQARQPFDHIILQAVHARLPHYNGSVLLDQLCPIVAVNCADTELPTLPTVDQSATTLSELIQKVHFDPVTDQLDAHYFLDANGQEHYLNQYLWQCIQLIRQTNSNPKLLLAVGGLNSTSIESRMFSLQQMLLQAGVGFKQFKIRPLKKKDRGKSWDGESEDGELMIRVR